MEDKEKAMKVMSGVLKKDGHLAVAHFLSSNQVNDHHEKNPAVVHDRLPDGPEMKRLFVETNLVIESYTDQPGFYLMLGRK